MKAAFRYPGSKWSIAKPFVVAGFEIFGKSLCVMEKIKRGWKVRLYGTNTFLTEEKAESALAKQRKGNS